jgi:hypothetical protein
VRHYKEIVNSVRPFRQKISLSDLIPILVAGWKDAGTPLPPPAPQFPSPQPKVVSWTDGEDYGQQRSR